MTRLQGRLFLSCFQASTVFIIAFYSIIYFATPTLAGGYSINDETLYLQEFPSLIANSYSVPRPADLAAACVQKGPVSASLPLINVTTNTNAAGLQATCGTGSLCVINPGVTVTLNGNVNVAALVNKGTVIWNDSTQTQAYQYLCGGYIVSEGDAVFNLTLTTRAKTAYIYIKDNGAIHPKEGARAFGGWVNGATKPSYPILSVTGSPMARTWSLLIETGLPTNTTITLMHNVNDMGWLPGDRIALATTTSGSAGTSQWFYIRAISGNTITLASDAQLTTLGQLNQIYLGDLNSKKQAEVMMLTRNVIITGDDFTQHPCGDAACPCRTNPGDPVPFTTCTLGLHILMDGSGQRFGGLQRIQYTRVEKCGQRGAIGRYCLHFHGVRDCPDCLMKGNAVEYSHHRGIIVHNTHMSTVTENVLYDVRGAGLYVEDGNELYNYITYNAVICPWPLDGALRGCTIPGTDNTDADTGNNQAAIWALSHTNHFTGNRACNSFNGLFFDPTLFPHGRGFSIGQTCDIYMPMGRVQGNTCHGHGRFGTYFVASDFPRKLAVNLTGNGWANDAMCAPWDSQGFDTGLSSAIWDNNDYDNVFVGSYSLGDVQYRNHYSLDNLNLIYHKETKNFNDGCSAHYLNYHFEGGAALLAGGWGTTIFENSTFKGTFMFESNHHCGLDIGALCNPQWIFINPSWQVTRQDFMTWNDGNNPTHGGIYSLSPPDAQNPASAMFPTGYQSVCHGAHTYLLALDGGKTCVTAASLGLNVDWENGILCKKPLRRLEIYTMSDFTTTDQAGTLQLQVSVGGVVVSTGTMYFMINANKQGYTIPVIATLDYQYRVVRSGGVPSNWIIEFSDPVVGNRWSPDQIHLTIDGRTCPSITTSQHDRRWIYSSDVDSFKVAGRGACTSYPDMPAINCKTVPPPPLMSCPELCTGCNGPNQYCDCGSGKCMCSPGFSGSDCSQDICDSARCGAHGKCTARFLGGNLPVTAGACLCEPPYVGAACTSNPCSGVDCGHGTCVATSATGFYCSCNAPYSGSRCNQSCNAVCPGGNPANTWPYSCAVGRTDPDFCATFGGCAYGNTALFNSPQWCCYANCDPCAGVICDTPDNDCMLPGSCSNGQCSAPQVAPDGYVCHSIVYGACKSGVCVGPSGTLSPTAAATKAPTSAPTKVPTSTPTTAPSKAPTTAPTSAPPTIAPTTTPSKSPTTAPTSPPASLPASGYLLSKSNGLFITLNPTANLVATAATTASATLFNFATITGGYSLQVASTTNYVSADNAGVAALVANRAVASGWETFAVTQPTTGYFAFTAVNDEYVAVQVANGNELIATVVIGGAVPDIALFSVVQPTPTAAPTNPPPPTSSVNIATATKVKLYSKSTNTYITVDSGNFLVTTATSYLTATTFNVATIAGGYTLQNAATSLFVSADNTGTSPLIANRGAAAGWETLNFIAEAGSTYAIQATDNNNLVAVQTNSQLLANVANSGTIPTAALFYVVSA